MPGAQPRNLNQMLDPYPLFGRLREAGRAVRIRTSFAGDAWLVTRYDDANALMRDRRLSSDPRYAGPALRERLERFDFNVIGVFPGNMIASDPPDHTRLRRLVSREFTPRRVAGLEKRVRAIVHAAFENLPTDRPADLVERLGKVVPTQSVCLLLGLSGEDPARLRERIDRITRLPTSDEIVQDIVRERAAWQEELGGVVEARRARPGDDLLSALITANEAGDRLSDQELVSMVGLIFGAGVETTSSLIGSGILLLLRHPEALEALRRDPSLIPSAVEELLRYEPTITLGAIRYAACDIPLGDVTIPAGDLVMVGSATANHDERRFSCPERFDVTRSDNAHLSFGQGVHYCLGAPLARLQIRLILEALLSGFERIELACEPEEVVWRVAYTRGPEHLPVRLVPAGGRAQ